MTPFQVYLFTRLDYLISFLDFWSLLLFTCGAFIFGIAVFAMPSYYHDMNQRRRGPEINYKERRRMRSIRRWSTAGCIVGFILAVAVRLIPNKQEMAVIYLLPKICNSEIAQELPGDLKSLYDMAKEYLKSLAPAKPAP